MAVGNVADRNVCIPGVVLVHDQGAIHSTVALYFQESPPAYSVIGIGALNSTSLFPAERGVEWVWFSSEYYSKQETLLLNKMRTGRYREDEILLRCSF